MEEYRHRLEKYAACIAGHMIGDRDILQMNAAEYAENVNMICLLAVKMAKKIIKRVDEEIEGSKPTV